MTAYINYDVDFINARSMQYLDPSLYLGYDPTAATDQSPLLNDLVQIGLQTKQTLRFFSPGQFLLNSPLVINVPSGPGVVTNYNFVLEGCGNAYLAQPGSAPWNSATIFIANFQNGPAITVNSARGVSLRHFGIYGLNQFSSTGAVISGLAPANIPANYLTAGSRNGVGFTGGGAVGSARYSPYAGIAVDATNSAIPADGGYPTLTYTGAVAGGSDCLKFEDISINGFAVGVAHGMSGAGGLSDLVTYRDVGIYNCDIAYAFGVSNGQSFGVNIEGGQVYYCRTVFDGVTYGSQQGCPPKVFGTLIVKVFSLINFATNWESFVLNDLHVEQFRTLGNYYRGFNASNLSLLFVGGRYSLSTFGVPGSLPPLLLETGAATTFEGSSILIDSGATAVRAHNFVSYVTPIQWKASVLSGGPVPNVLPFIGLSSATINVVMADGSFVNTAAKSLPVSDTGGWEMLHSSNGYSQGGRFIGTYNATRFRNRNVDYTFLPNGSTPFYTLTVSALTLTSSFGVNTGVTFTVAIAPMMVQVGDVLLWKFLVQGGSTVQAVVPGIQVTSVNAGTGAVVCSLMYDPAQYDTVANQPSTTALLMPQVQWAPTGTLTCTTDGTSAVLTSVSPPTVLINGDWIIGTAGIPANARVVAGGGTASVTINQVTTVAGTAVGLRFGTLSTGVINPTNSTLAISTNSPLTPAQTGSAYTTPIGATQGTPPYTWSLISTFGAANTWAINASTGVLSGTPGTAATDTICIQVIDSTGAAAQKTLALTTQGTLTPTATPTFVPATGTYASSQSVTISCATPAATIYYTTNGSTPTTSSAVYSGAITVSATSTVKAIATASGFTQSAVGSATYTIGTGSPGVVTAVTALATVRGASILFAAPSSNGGSPLASYTAIASPGGITATINSITTPAVGLSCRIDMNGLTAGTPYTFTVYATNTASLNGPPSSASNSVTPSAYAPYFVACGGAVVGLGSQWLTDYSFQGNTFAVSPGTPASNGSGHLAPAPLTTGSKVLEWDTTSAFGGMLLRVSHLNPTNAGNGRFNLAPYTNLTFAVYPTVSGQSVQTLFEKSVWINGVATGGSLTTVQDSRQNWPANQYAGGNPWAFGDLTQNISQTSITANTGTQVTFNANGGTVASGDYYELQQPDVTIGQSLQFGTGSAAYGPATMTANAWNTYTVPLSAFSSGADILPGQLILKFSLQDVTGNGTNTIYYCNVGFS